MQTEAPLELMIAYCEGSISNADSQKLQLWRDAHVHHDQFFRSFESTWTREQSGYSNFQPNVERALSRVHQRMARRLMRRRFSQVAATVMLMLGLWQFFSLINTETSYQQVMALQQTVLYLPDSTRVTLAKGACLDYPFQFDSDERAVKLTGKAFFDVQRNEQKPFVITTTNARTRVLGTQFTLLSTKEGKEEIYLDEGSVVFTKKGWFAEDLILQPGEKATLIDGALVKSSQENKNASAWATRKLRFVNTPLSQLIQEMEVFYGVSIQLQTDRTGHLRFTGTLSHATAEEALRVVALTLQLKLTRNSQTLTLSL